MFVKEVGPMAGSLWRHAGVTTTSLKKFVENYIWKVKVCKKSLYVTIIGRHYKRDEHKTALLIKLAQKNLYAHGL